MQKNSSTKRVACLEVCLCREIFWKKYMILRYEFYPLSISRYGITFRTPFTAYHHSYFSQLFFFHEIYFQALLGKCHVERLLNDSGQELLCQEQRLCVSQITVILWRRNAPSNNTQTLCPDNCLDVFRFQVIQILQKFSSVYRQFCSGCHETQSF